MLHLQAMYVTWNKSSLACVSSSNSTIPVDRLYHFFYFCLLKILQFFFHGFVFVYTYVICNLFLKYLTKKANCNYESIQQDANI